MLSTNTSKRRRILFKIISLVLIPAFLFSNVAVGETREIHTQTLAPFSVAKLISENESRLTNLRGIKDTRLDWIEVYSNLLAQKMVTQVKDFADRNVITLEDGKRELIGAITDWFGTQPITAGVDANARSKAFTTAIEIEFARLGTHASTGALTSFRRAIHSAVTSSSGEPVAIDSLIGTLPIDTPIWGAVARIRQILLRRQPTQIDAEELIRYFALNTEEQIALTIIVNPGQGSGELPLAAGSAAGVATVGQAQQAEDIPNVLRKFTDSKGRVDVTCMTNHASRDIKGKTTTEPIIPSAKDSDKRDELHKGGLTTADLRREHLAVDEVKKDIEASRKKGFLHWADRVLHKKNDIAAAAASLNDCRDIIILGAPALAGAVIDVMGLDFTFRGQLRRLHFIDNLEESRLDRMDEELHVDWAKTGLVFASQGSGDAIQVNNFNHIKSAVGIRNDHIIAVVPEGYDRDGISATDIERNGGVVLTTPGLRTTEGVAFNAEAFALTLTLAGHNGGLVIEQVSQAFEDLVSARRLSQTLAGFISATLRGQSTDDNNVKKMDLLPSALFSTVGVATYSRDATTLMSALAETWNSLVGARTQFDVVEMPDGQHHWFQMGLSALPHSVIAVRPELYPDIGKDDRIPEHANATVKSRPDKPFKVSEFMRMHFAGLFRTPKAGWGATNNPTPHMTFEYKAGRKGENNAAAIANLISVFQAATLISHKVGLKNKDKRFGEPLFNTAEEIASDLETLDKAVRDQTYNENAEFPTEDTPLALPILGKSSTWIDIRGLAEALGFDPTNISDPQNQKILAACLSTQLLMQRNHFDSKGSTHYFLNAPLEAAQVDDGSKKAEKFASTRTKARNIGRGGTKYFILAVGGAHNSSVNGLLPLRDFYQDEKQGKTINFIDTVDPKEIKSMCDQIRDDPEGTRILYVSNSGDTDESDIAYRRAIETLRDTFKQKKLHCVFASDAPDFAPNLSKIMGKEVTAEEYTFLRDRALIVTGENRGRLYDEMSHINFTTVPYPQTNGRQSIFELSLINQAFLDIPENRIMEYVNGAKEYVEGIFMFPNIIRLQEAAKAGHVNKSDLSAAKKEYKTKIETIENLIDQLSKGNATPALANKALRLVALDPGMFAGSLIGLLNRPDIPDETGVKIEGLTLGEFTPKSKVRVVYLSSLLKNDWLVKNDLVESLGKPQMQFASCNTTSSAVLNQLAALKQEKDSVVLLVVDERTVGNDLKEAQESLVGAAQAYLQEAGVPYATLHTSSAPNIHAATTFLLQTAAIGIGGQQVTASGYPRDANHLGEVWVTKARKFVRDTVNRLRDIEMAGGVDDIVEQWNLDPGTNQDHKDFIDFVKVAGKVNVASFPLVRGWDPSVIGDVEATVRKMIETVSWHVREDENMRNMCKAVLLVNPVTNEIEKIDLNPQGRHVGVFISDVPADASMLANTSCGIFSLFKLDDDVQKNQKPLGRQSLKADNLVVQTVFKYGAYPTAFVIAPRFDKLVTYNYEITLKDDGKDAFLVEYKPKLIGATHLAAMPQKGKSIMTVYGPSAKFPPVVYNHLEELTSQGVKNRDLGHNISNAAFLAQSGGITGGVQPLLNAFLTYEIMWHRACRGDKGLYFDEGGSSHIPNAIKIEDMFSTEREQSLLRPVLAIAADEDKMKGLNEARDLAQATPSQVRASKELLTIKLPELDRKADFDVAKAHTLDSVLSEALGRNRIVDDSLKSDVQDVARDLARISAVVMPSRYLDPESEEATGSNPSAELQFAIDEIATNLVEDYARQSGKVAAIITEEGEVQQFSCGRIMLTTDPVDGVGNLIAGFPTGQFFSLIDIDRGREIATLVYAQGAGRLIVGVGDATYVFQYILDNYKTGQPINFGSVDALQKGNFYLLGQIFDNSSGDESVPSVLGEGGTVNEYFDSVRNLRNQLIRKGAIQANAGTVVNDNANALLGSYLRLFRKTYVYPFTDSAKPVPEKAQPGGKLRVTEVGCMTGTAIGVVPEALINELATEQGQARIHDKARELYGKLLIGDPDQFDSAGQMVQEEMTLLAIDHEFMSNGLKGIFGFHKNPLWQVANVEDLKNVPAIANPIAIGDRSVVDQFEKVFWEEYANRKLASSAQAEESYLDWSPEIDHEWEVYGPHGRRARLIANPVVGAIKLANGLWTPVIGRDNVRAENGPVYLDEFAAYQERLYREMMGQDLAELAVGEGQAAGTTPASIKRKNADTVERLVTERLSTGEPVDPQEQFDFVNELLLRFTPDLVSFLNDIRELVGMSREQAIVAINYMNEENKLDLTEVDIQTLGMAFVEQLPRVAGQEGQAGAIGHYDAIETPIYHTATNTLTGKFKERTTEAVVDLSRATNIEEVPKENAREILERLITSIDYIPISRIIQTHIIGGLFNDFSTTKFGGKIVVFDHPDEPIISFGQSSLIGISRSLFDNPMSLLHEAAHVTIDNERLKQLNLLPDADLTEATFAFLIEEMLKTDTAQRQRLLATMHAKVGINAAEHTRDHYLLRAFQALAFGQRDRAFTLEIKQKRNTLEAVTLDVDQATRATNTRRTLPSEAEIDESNVAVVITRDLTGAFSEGKDSSIGATLTQNYQKMKQDLRTNVQRNGSIFVEVGNAEELVANVTGLVEDGKKVIVMDNASLLDHSLQDELSRNVAQPKAEKGLNYCIVSARVNHQLDSTIIQFANLNAMYNMGVGMLYTDTRLFRLAYRTFTGKDAPADLLESIRERTNWIIEVLPRMVRFVADDLRDTKKLRKLFDVAA